MIKIKILKMPSCMMQLYMATILNWIFKSSEAIKLYSQYMGAPIIITICTRNKELDQLLGGSQYKLKYSLSFLTIMQE